MHEARSDHTKDPRKASLARSILKKRVTIDELKRSTLGPVGIQHGRIYWKMVAAHLRSVRTALNGLKKSMAVGNLPMIQMNGEVAKRGSLCTIETYNPPS